MRQERVLAGLLIAEILFFSVTGHNFFSVANLFECVRLAAEIGLLSLALTPVIVAGGIDLSVGSNLGLCAVCLGALTRDAGVPAGWAAFVAVLLGGIGGLLNGALIGRLGVSALIVTLGTYSLFRGLAEAITGGAVNYSGFPPHFLFLGQGYLGRVVPTQMLPLTIAALFFYVLLQRSTFGRACRAIGFAPEAARYAGLPVRRCVFWTYLLSGLASGLAAVIYVAHLGQAKADAGTGYELTAITAVVLGGTSIFGGTGTIVGTLLGVAATIVLQNGLRLSGWPTEVAGMATGGLLLATVALNRWMMAKRGSEWMRLKLQGRSAGIYATAALFVLTLGAGAAWLMRGVGAGRHTLIGVMPKAKGDPYFISCRAGAERAARALGVEMIWDGPTTLDAARQNEVVEGWITRGVQAISVAVENGPSLSTVLRKARERGIHVVTWDADAQPDSREYFINQATPEAIASTLVDEAARLMKEHGEFAIITGALSAANQNQWIGFMKQCVAQRHPGLRLITIRPSDDDRDKAFTETQTLLRVYPQMKVVIAISAPAVPGAGEAVRQSGRSDVQVVGLSLPNLCKPYVHAGAIEGVVLWKTADLGYLSVAVPAALIRGALKPEARSFDGGSLGPLRIEGSQIILGQPFVFRRDNIDRYNF